MATVTEELNAVLAEIAPRHQERVPSFARELAQPPAFPRSPLPPGTPGSVVAKLRVSPEVGEALERALQDTEQAWPDEQ